MKRSVAVAAVLLLGLSACGTGDDSDDAATGGGGADDSGAADGEVEGDITFLTFETPNLTPQYWDEAIGRITAKHPGINVERIVSPTDDRTEYARQLQTSGQFPDVLIAVSPAGFAEAGELYAWSDEELDQFLFPTNGAVDGEVYQLPANTQTIPVVYYNKDMFSEAGITEPPTTYDELLDTAEQLKEAGIKPFVAGGQLDSLGPMLSGILASEVYAENPEWMHDRRADEVSFSDAEFTAGAEKLAELAERGYIDPANVSRDHASVQEAFLAGDGAMYPMGNWFASAVDNAEEPPPFEIGQFFWPSDDGSPVVPAFTGGGLLVNANSDDLDAARTFALEFQLDQENLEISARADGLFPAIEGWEPPEDVGPTYQEGFDLYQEALEEDAVVPAFGFEAGDDGMVPGMVDKYIESAVDIISGNKSVDEVTEFLDNEWDSLS